MFVFAGDDELASLGGSSSGSTPYFVSKILISGMPKVSRFPKDSSPVGTMSNHVNSRLVPGVTDGSAGYDTKCFFFFFSSFCSA